MTVAAQQKKFVFDTEKQVIEEGERLERAEYWGDVKSYAQEIVRENRDSDEEDSDHAHESADGSQWVIYTHRNLDVLRFTENDNAFDEYGGLDDRAKQGGLSGVLSFVAYAALNADIQDELRTIRENIEEHKDELFKKKPTECVACGEDKLGPLTGYKADGELAQSGKEIALRGFPCPTCGFLHTSWKRKDVSDA